MDKSIESYRLGNIQVIITEDAQSDKLQVDCSDGSYHSSFTISPYEHENYKRHMNQRIKNAFDKQHKKKYS